jgi:hypothetical protein
MLTEVWLRGDRSVDQPTHHATYHAYLQLSGHTLDEWREADVLSRAMAAWLRQSAAPDGGPTPALTRPPQEPNEPELNIGDIQSRLRKQDRHLWAQELVRAGLAIALFLLLAVTVVWVLFLAGTSNWPNAKEALQILLPAETGLLGSAAGFYFASRRSD